MTFKELQDATIFGRFKEGNRSFVKTWLNTRMARVWTAFEWSFRIAEPTAVTAKQGDRYLGPAGSANELPPDFGEIRSVWNDNADKLEELEEDTFNGIYLYGRVKGQTGKPEAFTVVNRKIILGPVPDADRTYYAGYKRLMCHLDDGGTVDPGAMVEDGDKPYWPDEHHELLVVGAQALGLKLINDPAWFSLEQQHDDLVAGMLADGLVLDALASGRQYGRDSL